MRKLLSHTAGLTDGNGFPGYQTGAPLPTLLEILNGSAKVNSKPITVGMKPGSFFQYSGGGYEILELLIEDVTGQAFSKFMMETILMPLGMTHSTFDYPLLENNAVNAASAHNRNEVVKGRWHIYPEKAAAGLWTTPSDMAKMIISVHKCVQGTDKQGLSKIVGQKLCQEMLTMHTWPLKNGRTKHMGLGFMVENRLGIKTFRHGGANEGIKCEFLAVASGDELHGTVIMTNSSRGNHVIDELEKTIDDVYGWQAYKPIEKEVADIDYDLLRKRVGTSYAGTQSMIVSVIEREGHLALIDVLDSPPQPIDIFPENENLFFDLEGAKHEFTGDEYIWTPPGWDESMRFKKVE